VSVTMTGDIEQRTIRKVSMRLLPTLFALYIAAFLDRTNVSLAALQMNQDIGLSAKAYGLGAGIFFIGYGLFEVPSNLFLARVGARVWIARIMLTWGLMSAAFMFVKTPTMFYVMRFDPPTG
jgi:sugar phosphate permease